MVYANKPDQVDDITWDLANTMFNVMIETTTVHICCVMTDNFDCTGEAFSIERNDRVDRSEDILYNGEVYQQIPGGTVVGSEISNENSKVTTWVILNVKLKKN